jgi:hypothetical protein
MAHSTIPSRKVSASPTLASSDGSDPEKIDSGKAHPPCSLLESHTHNVDTYGRSASLEDTRPSLYPVTSYASQIGGEGTFREEELEDIREEGEKDPNLVEWDGPKDPANPFNWYVSSYAYAHARSTTYKWWLTFEVSIMTLCVAFTSSVLYGYVERY